MTTSKKTSLKNQNSIKNRKWLEAFLDRKKKENNDFQRRREERNLKQKCEALEKIRESFKTEETDELETFVHFKLTAVPEAFREMIEHMKYYEEVEISLEAEGVISALSVQESGAENVTENKTLEKLEEERSPSFFVQESGAGNVTENKTLEERGPSFFVPLIPHTKSPNEEKDLNDLKCRLNVLLDRKVQKNQSINSEKETCKFLKFGKCRHGLSGKEPVQEKVCSYKHSQVCREHEKWGVCYDNRCEDFHLKSCREFMNNQYCTYGESCRFWHPTGLKDFRMGHERKEHNSKEEFQTELKNSRVFYGKNHSYLRQQGNLMQNPFLDLNQGQNTQRTFLELRKDYKERQKKISEIVRILEQNNQ